MRIARKNAFLTLFDGWGTLAADVAFISSTYAAHGGGGTHTYTHIARTYNILREGRDRFWLAARRLKDIVVLGRRRRRVSAFDVTTPICN